MRRSAGRQRLFEYQKAGLLLRLIFPPPGKVHRHIPREGVKLEGWASLSVREETTKPHGDSSEAKRYEGALRRGETPSSRKPEAPKGAYLQRDGSVTLWPRRAQGFQRGAHRPEYSCRRPPSVFIEHVVKRLAIGHVYRGWLFATYNLPTCQTERLLFCRMKIRTQGLLDYPGKAGTGLGSPLAGLFDEIITNIERCSHNVYLKGECINLQ